jgi:hypothetical protein
MLGLAFALKSQTNERTRPSTELANPAISWHPPAQGTHLEPINLVHVARLVVPPVQKDPLRVQPFVREKRQGDLDGPRTSVDEISVEDDGVIVSRRGEDGQEVAEVVELLRGRRIVSAKCYAA